MHIVLISLGFSQSKADTSLFFKSQNDNVVYLLIYVDDILITGNSPSCVQDVIDRLGSHFSLKKLGEVKTLLGIEVTKTKQGIHLCQSTYIRELLAKLNMQDAKGISTPMLSSPQLSKLDGSPFTDGKLYRSTVGALQYATISRPKISYSVNKVSQYMASPLDTHWRAIKLILRYLAGTIDYGLHIRRSTNIVSAFCDFDWASDLDDRSSVTGYCTFFGSNLVSWSSKKQSVISRSSTEAEYRSLAYAASEVIWIMSLLSEINMLPPKPPTIWVDNLSAISIASNPVLHARTKHIEIDVHFVCDKVLAK